MKASKAYHAKVEEDRKSAEGSGDKKAKAFAKV